MAHGVFAMIHELTIGHLDPNAIGDRQAVALRPLDGETVARVLAEFPGLIVQPTGGHSDRPLARAGGR